MQDVAHQLFQRAMSLKASTDPRDADGDGIVDEGKPSERPANKTAFINEKVLNWARTKFKDEQVAANFAVWFADSKMVNENGEPIVFYHGTGTKNIDEFTPQYNPQALELHRKAVQNNERFGYMNFRSGTFFSPKPEYAGHYASDNKGVVYPVYIKASNPVWIDQTSDKDNFIVDPKRTPDALIMHTGRDINEIAIIDPRQIKSALSNSGEFAPSSSQITKAFRSDK